MHGAIAANVQHHALQIIVGNIPYEEACRLFNLPLLAERRLSLCRTLFKQITNESHMLHYLLPAKCDANLVSRLRCTIKYPTVRLRTNRFKNSFILYSLSNFQRHLQT